MNTALSEPKIAVPLLTDNHPARLDDELIIDANGNAYDKNGAFVGRTWDVVQDELTWKLSEAYGVDFFKVDRMIASGELKEDELTNELLLSPEFKFEPYPGFKPAPPQKPANLDPEWEAAMKEAIESFENEDE
jgi:hypothetical protein